MFCTIIKVVFWIHALVFASACDYNETENIESPIEHPGKPIDISWCTSNHSIDVDYKALETIFLHSEVKDRKVIVFTFNSPARRGKRLFLDYSLRYLYENVSKI